MMSEATTSSTDSDDSDNDGDTNAVTTTSKDGHTVVTTTDGHGHVTSVTSSADTPSHWHRHGGFDSWMAIIVLVIIAGIIKTAIRARHGDTRTNRQRRADRQAGVGFVPPAAANRENEALAEENAKLRVQATRMEERIAVLERIVTDPAKRVSDEIDALR